MALWLIYAQGMHLFKKGGSFVIKLFDTFTQASVDIMFMLSCFMKELLIKPNTSRSANSEKYAVF